jgi:hypothetical protein
VVVPVMGPAHTSVALGTVVTVAEHSLFTTGNAYKSGTGASLSFTITLKLHKRLVLPDPSVAMYDTIVVPPGNVYPLGRPLTSAMVPEQLSVNAGVE